MGTSSPIHISIKKNTNFEKLYNSIVRIHDVKDNYLGTGFLLKLNIVDEDYFFLVTTNEVITLEHDEEIINMYYGKSENETELQIKIENIKNRSKFIFYHPADITIIEMLDSDNIPKDKFLNADMNYKHGYDIYKENNLILAGYQQNGKVFEKFITYGEINKIMDYVFEYKIETKIDSIGSVICLEDSLLVIGIHKKREKNISFGTFIGFVINKLEDKRKNKFKPYIMKYEGDMVEGLRHGKGTGYYNDGSTYEGDWACDKREGTGRMKYTNGNIYEGNWKNDLREGKGKFYFINGGFYEGEFKNNIIDGYGTLWIGGYKEADRFEGTMKLKNFDGDDFHTSNLF